MGFVKVLKNKAYSKRYQTKFRRRRQGKTDYYARKRLVVNDKTKYDTKKYRFVVRRTNQRIICQVIYTTITGDITVCSADSKELNNFGVTCGLTNYAAAYATGLLCARRLLKMKDLAKEFEGQTNVDGKLYSVVDHMKERRPFKAYLDVGLVRTTTGNRVFGAMKGACDGGLHIPHNEKRFPGYRIEKAEAVTNKRGKKEEDQDNKAKAVFTAEEHAEHIFGVHVEEYYDLLKKKDPTAFKRQFSRWEKALKGKSFTDYYTACHKAIRANPDRVKRANKATKPKVIQKAPTMVLANSKGAKWLRQKKIGHAARKLRVQAKIQKIVAAM